MNIAERILKQCPWKGFWLMGVAGLHTVIGLVLFYPTLGDMAAQGFYDTVGEEPLRGAVVWFLFFGFMLFALGLAVLDLELQSEARGHNALAICLLLTVVLGILLMPVSGFWLALPPAFGLLERKRKSG